MTKAELLSGLRAYAVACEKFGYISPSILQHYADQAHSLFEDNTDTVCSCVMITTSSGTLHVTIDPLCRKGHARPLRNGESVTFHAPPA